MASTYWRWQWPSGDQRGWVQKYDPACLKSFTDELMRRADVLDACRVCSQTVDYPHEIILHGYIYIPNRDRIDLELLFCEECFMRDEQIFTRGGRRLTERGVEGGGAPALHPADDPWAAIGLKP